MFGHLPLAVGGQVAELPALAERPDEPLVLGGGKANLRTSHHALGIDSKFFECWSSIDGDPTKTLNRRQPRPTLSGIWLLPMAFLLDALGIEFRQGNDFNKNGDAKCAAVIEADYVSDLPAWFSPGHPIPPEDAFPILLAPPNVADPRLLSWMNRVVVIVVVQRLDPPGWGRLLNGEFCAVGRHYATQV
jgi:hypothetical protein